MARGPIGRPRHSRVVYDLRERVKELTAIIRTSRLLQDSTRPIADVINEIALMLPQGWQYPEVTAVRIVLGDESYSSLNFTPTAWRQRAAIVTSGGECGWIEVFYLEPRPQESEGPFMIEERDLLNVVAEMLGSYVERRRTDEALKRAHDDLEARVEDRTRRIREYQDQLRTLTMQLSSIEERERRRIAVELHDQIGQSLAVIKIRLGALAMQTETPEIALELNAIRELTEDAIRFTRSLMTELSPPALYELSCAAAIEWLADQVREKYGLAIGLSDDGRSKNLGDDTRAAVFKSVRELLMNVVKHAHARDVQISMNRDGMWMRVEVRDDGVGFDPENRAALAGNGGFGLLSIRERMGHVGGSFRIDSTPGQGTRAVLIAPLLESLEGADHVS